MDPLQNRAGTLWDDTIRPVTPGDVPALKALIDATGLFPSVLLDDMLGPYLAQATDGPIWLTAGHSSLAAVAYCAPEQLTSGTSNLYLIAVHPDRQQHGIGRALIANVERLLSVKGERLLVVETSGLPMFQGARDFYVRCGFEEEARIRDFYQDGEDKIVFRKQISTLATKVGNNSIRNTNSSIEQDEVLVPASPVDRETILQMAEAFHAEDRHPLSAAGARALSELILDPAGRRGTVFIIRNDGRVVGYVVLCLGYSIEWGGRDAFVDDFYLVPRERGRGVGTRVLRSLELIAGRDGCSALHLEVVAGNGVRGFYQRAGYSNRGSTFLSKRLDLTRGPEDHVRVGERAS